MTAKTNSYQVVQLTKYKTHQVVFKPDAHLLVALCFAGRVQDPSNINKSHLQPPQGTYTITVM